MLLESFEDTEGVIRICKSKDRQNNGQNDEQPSTKHTYETKEPH